MTNSLPRIKLLLALASAVFLTVGCATPGLRPADGDTEDDGKRKRLIAALQVGGTPRPLPNRAPGPSLSSPDWDSERLWSTGWDWEPAVAADPNAPYVYQLTTRFGTGTVVDPGIMYRRSVDGGLSWEPERLLHYKAGDEQGDPLIEVADDTGIVYAAYLDRNWGLQVMRSDDFGVSWNPPVPALNAGVPPSGADKPAMAVSPDGQHVYLAFNWGSSWVVSSHDFAQTFSNPTKTSTGNGVWFHQGGVVTPGGEVYFGAADYTTNDIELVVIRSDDQGQTWSDQTVDVSRLYPTFFLGPSMSVGADPNGLLCIAYHAGDTAGEEQQMYVRTSPDGSSWSARLPVGFPSPDVNHAFPGVATGSASGTFHVVWQDDRASPGRWNTWYRSTTDSGLTWSDDVRLSDHPFGPTYKSPQGYFFPYGDYLEIDSGLGDRVHVIWGEGRSYTADGGSWYTRSR